MTAAFDILSSLRSQLAYTKPAKLPRYKQLYEAIRQLILDGWLSPGACLPSSRLLTQELKLSRNTALAAIDQLCAEGYAETRPASGVYVLPTAPNWDLSGVHRVLSSTLSLSNRGQRLSKDARPVVKNGFFSSNIPDLRQFPFELWQRYVNRYARNPKLSWQAYPRQGGCLELRQAIAEYVRTARGIQCDAKQILITHGAQAGLQLVAHLLADAGDRVWLENPGYPGAYNAFTAAGLCTIGQPVDEEGIAPALKAWRKPPRLIYTTPSHQFPLGVVMSAARRRQLLAQASQHKTWIIEDDYDSEFRYSGTPLAALQALSANQVIYLGSFSKTLFPALRIGYLILPENLFDDFRAFQARHLREPSYVTQSALADFIRDGHFSAHIRKMRREYQYRRDALITLFEKNFHDNVQLKGTSAGLHLLVQLPKGADDSAIEQQANQYGIAARSIQHYNYHHRLKLSALILGFGHTDLTEIDKAGNLLIKVIKRHLTPSH